MNMRILWTLLTQHQLAIIRYRGSPRTKCEIHPIELVAIRKVLLVDETGKPIFVLNADGSLTPLQPEPALQEQIFPVLDKAALEIFKPKALKHPEAPFFIPPRNQWKKHRRRQKW